MDIEESVIDSRKEDDDRQKNGSFGVGRKRQYFLWEDRKESDGDIDVDEDIDQLPATKDEPEGDTKHEKQEEERKIAGQIVGDRQRRKQVLEKRHNHGQKSETDLFISILPRELPCQKGNSLFLPEIFRALRFRVY